MTMGLMLMLAQAGTWTATPNDPMVGDTVVVERLVPVSDAAAQLRLLPLESSELVEPLRDPEAVGTTDGFIVRYLVALFESGPASIAMPDVEVVFPDGRTETLVGREATVVVRSVLPDADSLPPPRPSRAPIARHVTAKGPAAALVTGIIVLTIGWRMVRRRSRLRPNWSHDQPPTEVPLARWITAGEPRAVATHTMNRFRDRIAELEPEASRSLSVEECIALLTERRPEWPLHDLTETMRHLERASYAPAVSTDVIALAEEADTLFASLSPEPEPEPEPEEAQAS